MNTLKRKNNWFLRSIFSSIFLVTACSAPAQQTSPDPDIPPASEIAEDLDRWLDREGDNSDAANGDPDIPRASDKLVEADVPIVIDSQSAGESANLYANPGAETTGDPDIPPVMGPDSTPESRPIIVPSNSVEIDQDPIDRALEKMKEAVDASEQMPSPDPDIPPITPIPPKLPAGQETLGSELLNE